MSDRWLGIFLFFLLTEDSKRLLCLINGEDFNFEFDNLVYEINEVDSDTFKDACINGLLKNKYMLEDLNRAYKTLEDRKE